MSSVDNRIVRMDFQNSDFEKNIAQSDKSLKTFQKTLDNFGDSTIASSLEKISSKFSTLGIIGVTALQNITNQAIDTGKTLVKSLTTDNILSGWTKLEEQTKAVGTLVSQGLDVNYVTKQLEKLQWYTDETSYNFNDMLTAASRFTATGQTLDASITTLQGIANWAAVSGQNATAASSAMRELAQAAGRGYLTLQDWSSIQTLMMDNTQVRDIILDTAISMGTLKRNSDGTYKSLVALTDKGFESFTKSQMVSYLTTGRWFTTDVLVEVMRKYAAAVDPVYEYVNEHNVTAAEAIESLEGVVDDFALTALRAAQEARTLGDALGSVREGVASSWQTTFGIILGNYKEQRALWTELADRLYDVFVVSGEIRNDILREWADLGGREKLLQGLWNIFDAIVKISDTVKTAFRNIFPSKTAEDLLSLTEKFENFTSKLIISDETAEKIGRTLQGLFSILRLGKDVLYAILKPIASLMGSSNGLLDSILTITQYVGDAITVFTFWAEEVGLFEKISEVLIIVFKAIGEAIKWVVGIVKTYAIPAVGALVALIAGVVNGGLSLFESIKDKITGFLKAIGLIKESKEIVVDVARAYSAAIEVLDDEEIDDAADSVKNLSGVFSNFSTNVKIKYETYLKPALEGLWGLIKNIFSTNTLVLIGKILAAIASFKLIYGIINLITAIPTAIANVIRGLGNIILGLGNILRGVANYLNAKAALKFALAIGLVTASLIALTFVDIEAIKRAGMAVIAIAIGLKFFGGIIASFGSMIASINWGGIVIGLIATVAALFVLSELVPKIKDMNEVFVRVFSKENVKLLLDFAKAWIELSAVFYAVRIVANVNKLIKAFRGLTDAISGFSLIKINNVDTSWAAKLLKFASAIALISGSIIALSWYANNNDLSTGLWVISSLMAALVAMQVFLSKFVETNKSLSSIGGQILKMAIGIGVLALSFSALSKLNWENIGKATVSLLILGGILTGLMAATKLISSSAGKIIALAIGLDLVAGAVVVLAATMALISFIPAEDIGNYMWSLAISIVAVAAGLSLLSNKGVNAGRMLAAAFAIDLVSVAIMAIAGSLYAIAMQDPDHLKQSLISLAVTFGVVSTALVLVSSITKAINVGQLILAAVAIDLVAIAIAGIAAAFWLLNDVYVEDALKVIVAIGLLIAEIVSLTVALAALSDLFPATLPIVLAVAAIVAAMALAVYSFSKVTEAIAVLADVLAEKGDKISDAIDMITEALARGIKNIAVSMVEAAMIMAVGGSKAIISFIEGLVDGYLEMRDKLHEIAIDIGWLMLDGISLGLAGVFRGSGGLTKIVDASNKILDKIFEVFDINSPAGTGIYTGEMFDEGMAIGLENSKGRVAEATYEVVQAAQGAINVDDIEDFYENLGDSCGKMATQGLKTGVESESESVNTSFGNLGTTSSNWFSDKFKDGFKLADIGSFLDGSLFDSFYNDVLNPDSKTSKAATAAGSAAAIRFYQSMDNTLSSISKNPRGYKSVDEFMSGKWLSIDLSDMRLSSPAINEDDIEDPFDDYISKILDFDDISTDIDLKTNLDVDDSKLKKSLEDYELTLKQLVEKYAVISDTPTIEDDGRVKWTWEYNGPMGGVIDEYTEWVYEGPTSGIYDKLNNELYGELGGQLIDLNNWESEWEDFWYAGNQETISTINDSTANIISAIDDQTLSEQRYNSDVLDALDKLGIKLDDVDMGISGLSDDLGGLGIYLDSGVLVGELTPRLDKALGNRQSLVTKGVIK